VARYPYRPSIVAVSGLQLLLGGSRRRNENRHEKTFGEQRTNKKSFLLPLPASSAVSPETQFA